MTLTAPYNFVPVSERVCTAKSFGLPEGLPSQDNPASGGLCGEVQITLATASPILVAGAGGGRERKFFETPDGRAIMGSTIRGMIRNMIEIASFGKMQLVENRRFGMRDLADATQLDYRNRMSETKDGAFAAKARGGWLTETAEGLFLEEVSYGRIEHEDLFGRKRPNEKTAKDLEAKYSGPNPRTVYIEDQPKVQNHSNGKKLFYRKAYVTNETGCTKVNAQIVFTGMPSGKKHMEFAFPQSSGAGSGEAVPAEVWEKFLDVHENLEKPSPTWKHRRDKLQRGEAIPVFFLTGDNGDLEQIGLSMMFKMAGENTTHQMMPKSDHVDENLIDLATRMFGRINTDEGSFKGRLSFGIMAQTNQTGLKYLNGKWLILSSPKPSYFPSYVRQRDLRDDTHIHERAQYRSYMTWKKSNGMPGGPDTIRGWKRYPHPQAQVDPVNTPAHSNESNKSASKLFPLETGATFAGTIRFHNLHAIELGALLWALEWGNDDSCFHSVGMGKPFGWGRSKISVDKMMVHYEEEKASDYVAEFTTAMNKAISGWSDTPQIKSLLEMARANHGADVIGQMELTAFRDAKSARKVLPDIGFATSEVVTPIPSIEANAKGAEPHHNQGGAGRQNIRPPEPELSLSVGGTVYYGGEEVKITAINNDTATVQFEDGGTEEAPLALLKYN